MAWVTVLGIPAAVYVMSVTALMFFANEQQQNPLLLLGAGLLTAGIYIFHRTSIVAVEPMQERHRIALRRKFPLRAVSCVCLVIAAYVFALHKPVFSLLVIVSFMCVIAYGRKTVIKPLRAYLFLKPTAVGFAIVMFAWMLNDMANSIPVVICFILISSADAMLCDAVDCEYDSASGCPTLAINLGEHWIKIITMLMYTIASIGICFTSQHNPTLGVFFYIVFVVSAVFQKIDSRYLVDLRLVLVLLLAWGEWILWNG